MAILRTSLARPGGSLPLGTTLSVGPHWDTSCQVGCAQGSERMGSPGCYLARPADAGDSLWPRGTCTPGRDPCGVDRAGEAGDSSPSDRVGRRVAALGLAQTGL